MGRTQKVVSRGNNNDNVLFCLILYAVEFFSCAHVSFSAESEMQTWQVTPPPGVYRVCTVRALPRHEIEPGSMPAPPRGHRRLQKERYALCRSIKLHYEFSVDSIVFHGSKKIGILLVDGITHHKSLKACGVLIPSERWST